MKEVICINIGQSGIHVGNTFWEQITLEHDIQPDGTRLNTDDNDNISSFFSENDSGKLIPRCISVDLDNETFHGVNKSSYRELFQADSFIYGKDGGCLYSKANNEMEGKEVQQRLFSKIKALTESCEGLQGFMIFHSISGGTGSGLGSAIARHLDETYRKSTKIDLVLYPSPKLSNSVVEPYNTVLAHKDLAFNDLNLIFDNEAL
jgi:tubulin alpha